jgi:hypothetical protein
MSQEVYIILAVGFVVFGITYLYQWVTYLREVTQNKISKGFKLFQWTGKYLMPESDWDGRNRTNKKYSGSDYFKDKSSLEQYLKSKDIELLWCEDITGETKD